MKESFSEMEKWLMLMDDLNEQVIEERGEPSSECCDAPLKNYNNGDGICSDCGEHASAIEESLAEGILDKIKAMKAKRSAPKNAKNPDFIFIYAGKRWNPPVVGTNDDETGDPIILAKGIKNIISYLKNNRVDPKSVNFYGDEPGGSVSDVAKKHYADLVKAKVMLDDDPRYKQTNLKFESDEQLDELTDKMRPHVDNMLRVAKKQLGKDAKFEYFNKMPKTSELRVVFSFKDGKERAFIYSPSKKSLRIASKTTQKESVEQIEEKKSPVNYTLGNKPDKDYLYQIIKNGEPLEGDLYHSLEDAKRVLGNKKKTNKIDKFKINRVKRNKLAGPKGKLPEAKYAGEEEISELSKDEKKGEPLANTVNRLIKKHAPKSKVRAKPYRPMRREKTQVEESVEEAYPMGMAPNAPEDRTEITYNQTKNSGPDAQVTINARAPNMEELKKVLAMAGLDPEGAEKHDIVEPDSVKVVDVSPADSSPCGSSEPLGMSYSTDKTALIDMLRNKLQQKLG